MLSREFVWFQCTASTFSYYSFYSGVPSDSIRILQVRFIFPYQFFFCLSSWNRYLLTHPFFRFLRTSFQDLTSSSIYACICALCLPLSLVIQYHLQYSKLTCFSLLYRSVYFCPFLFRSSNIFYLHFFTSL